MTFRDIQKIHRFEALAFLALTFVTAQLEASQNFYTADFSSPLNQPGLPPATGMGQQTPSRIVFGNPTVVSSFGHLTNQPLLFTALNYQQIQFDLGNGVPDYFVDFDFETRNLNPSLFAFVILFDTPSVENFYLHGNGYIGVPPANSPYLPGWSDGDLHHMHIGVNLGTGSWLFQLDNRAAVTGPFFSDSGDVFSMRMNLSAWKAFTPDDPTVQVAIDNVIIGTSVPEPSSVAITSLFCGALTVRSLIRKKRGT